MFYYAYGYPMSMPYYAPYMGDPCVIPGMYAGNPGCANFTTRVVGAGACRGGVAARALGGTGAGGCVGGTAGGSGGVVVAVGGVLAVVVVREMFFRKGSLVERNASSKRLWAAGAFGAQGWR